ncbi:MAG: hypothetical protein ACRDE2_15385 [Chitinophagaceae bacterium]
MKKTSIVIAAFILIMATGCSNNNPKAAAQKFLTAFTNGDNTTVTQMITKDSQTFWEKYKEEVDYASRIINKPKDEKDTYIFKDGQVKGDFSTQTFIGITIIPSQGKNDTTTVPVSLTKENGKWKVMLQNTFNNIK